VMKTSYVGTKGYQAPELLLNRPYDMSADVFSAGVVLFILLTGYPPFEQAHKSDRWFRPLAKGDYRKFWELHQGCTIGNDPDAKDLLQRMLTYNPKNRITLAEVKRHKWFNGKYLEGKDLVKVLRNRYGQMEQKRRKDAKKLKDLQTSITRTIDGLDNHEAAVELYPLGEVEGVWDTHTTAKWKDVYNTVNTVVHEVSGNSSFNFEDNTLTCSVKLQNPNLLGESLVRFHVRVFRSREFQNGPAHEDSESEDDTNKKANETVNVVRFRRLEGDVLDWKKILNQVIYKKCTTVLTGLPKWARNDLTKVNAQNTEEDDYDNVLATEGLEF
jgi:serine/threonine protein kinase